jgi:hypothetical protein
MDRIQGQLPFFPKGCQEPDQTDRITAAGQGAQADRSRTDPGRAI